MWLCVHLANSGDEPMADGYTSLVRLLDLGQPDDVEHLVNA
jgi:hypothetical protein